MLLAKQWLGSTQLPIETDILKLLPKNRQNPVVEQAFESVTDNMSQQVVFALTAANDKDLYAAAGDFAHQLKGSDNFSEVTGHIDEKTQQQWATYYYNNRFQQLTPEQRQRLSQAPQQQLQKVIQQIYNPFSGVTGKELNSDPFLLFRDYLTQVSSKASNFNVKNGYLYTQYQDQPYLLITATLAHSPYGSHAQKAVQFITQAEHDISQRYGASTLHTGVVFYADFGAQSAKSEISTIGVFSLVGVVLLLLVVFRSTTPLLLALLSIGIGLICAMAITTLIFGKVHLFSLVFGASLIGVSIDYAFHYLTERLAQGDKWDSYQGLKHIFAAISLGLVTSLVGYLGMLIAPFPGLQQLAVFSAIGLIAAYASVVAWYPILASKPSNNQVIPGQALWNAWFKLWQKPAVKIGLPLATFLVSGLLVTQAQYNDDIRQLQALPHNLKQQEQKISELSGLQASSQMLLITASNSQALLEKLEQLDSPLNKWKDDNIISGYQSLSQYLPSNSRQSKDYQLIKSLYQQQGKPLATALGLNKTPQFEHPFAPISLDTFLSSDVSKPVRFLYLGALGNHVAAVVTLNYVSKTDVSKTHVIHDFAQKTKGVYYLNKAEEISNLFAEYRGKILELLGGAILVILLVVSMRYGLKHGVLIVLPSMIACIAGLAVTVVIGSNLNLFNLLALILIVGIGIDYTLFFAEKTRSASTLLAISLSAATTLLSFGLLALSNTHAIHSFGLTVLCGIFIAWLLAPLAIKPHSLEKENL